MSLEAGRKLGSYEIAARIGAGGMGEVYRARDTTLDRDVAIKVLPEEFANDEERLARFKREAKLLASLNHPNIASIYGFETQNGINALVLELVEGPTLAERIADGKIPVDEALAIAKQIAEALEAGHEASVIHRDLKPANIKVKEDGTVKVLDYGLAKALGRDAANSTDSELSQSPTLTRQGTQIGVILGTAAYMSPEQATGKRVDKRTDIWAFGAVVYEMLTANRAFGGDDVSETLAAVLRAEPDLDELPAGTPDVLRRVLELCLTKDARQRLHDMADVRLALEGGFETATWVAGARSTEPGIPAASALVRAWRWISFGALAALLVLVVLWVARSGAPVSGIRYLSASFEEPRYRPYGTRHLAISRDGTQIAYAGTSGISIRDLAQRAPVVVYPGGDSPFFSPDGHWVAFFADGLRRVSVTGGAATLIAPPTGGGRVYGGSWGDDGTIVAAYGTGLFQVSSEGGEFERVLTANTESSELFFAFPEFLPQRRQVLYTVVPNGSITEAAVALLDLDTREPRVLVDGGTSGRYLASGHLMYAFGSEIRAVGYEIDTESVSGSSELLENLDVAIYLDNGAADFAVSVTGTLAYLPPASRRQTVLTWFDREGNRQDLGVEPGRYRYPRVSPQGDRVVFDRQSVEGRDLFVWDRVGGISQLTSHAAEDGAGLWSLDGETLFFASGRSGAFHIYSMPADGSSTAVPVFTERDFAIPMALTPDGDGMLTTIGDRPGQGNIYFVDLSNPKSSRPVLETEAREQTPTFSPNGEWIAYSSESGGQTDVYVRPFPDVDAWQEKISIEGGTQPLWGPEDSAEIYYRAPDGRVMVARFESDPNFRLTRVDELFVGPVPGDFGGKSWDISPIDQRFLMITNEESILEHTDVAVVLDWFEELIERVPIH